MAAKTLYLYDPKTNLLTPTTYPDLERLVGMKRANLASYKSRGQRIGSIGCYLVDENIPLAQRRVWYAREKYKDEAWKTIEGSNHEFLISSYGRVKRVFKKHEKFLLPHQRKGRGNLFVRVRFRDKYKEFKVGFLVATHFIRDIKPDERVVRKNGIVTDDYVGNLKICTLQEMGRMTGYKSKSKGVVQLDPKTGEIINEFRSAREAGRHTNFSHQAVLDRCNGVFPYKDNDFVFVWADEYEELESVENSQ